VIELKTNSFLTNIFTRNYKKIYEELLSTRRTLVMSFNPFILLRFRLYIPGIKIGFICGNRFFKFLFQHLLHKILKPEVYIVNKRFLNKRTVRFAKNNGMKIYSYIMNRNEDMHKALDLNIDGIVTDYPL
jgi:glycerophosphoryl diester phosphodiesterase